MKAGYQLEDVFVVTFKPKPLGFYLYVKFLGDNIILTGSPKFNLVPIINGRVFQVEPTHSGYIGADGSFYMLNAADGMINRIDSETLTLHSQIKVGRNPMIMVVR